MSDEINRIMKAAASGEPPPQTLTPFQEMSENAVTLAEIAGEALAQRDIANEIAETWSSVATENATLIEELEGRIQELRDRIGELERGPW